MFSKPGLCASGACVEADLAEPGLVQVRDSKAPDVVLQFNHDEWRAFIAAAKTGQYDV